MPNKLLSMNKIRQVLRCYASSKGTKTISGMLNVSRNTVNKYLQIYQKSQLEIDKVLSLDNASLFALFQEKRKPLVVNERYDALQNLLPEYCRRLKKKGVTRHMLHQEYLCLHPDGYGHSVLVP